MKDLFIETYENGSYYYPAYRRYGNEPELLVGCDKCLENDIRACISWNNIDLCMACIVDIGDYLDELESEEEL